MPVLSSSSAKLEYKWQLGFEVRHVETPDWLLVAVLGHYNATEIGTMLRSIAST